MSAIDHVLATFEPISLDAANDIAELQTRIDRKYLVSEPVLWQLLDSLAPTSRVLEIDGEQSCGYRSTYFDTEDLALYRAAVQGRRLRCKVRSRAYGDSGPCFLEVKLKGQRGANVKSRIGYRRDECSAVTAAGRAFIDENAGRAAPSSRLIPVLHTEYDRSTLIDPQSRTRITFDRRLRCSDDHGNEAMLSDVVVETKSAGAPSAVDRWLWEHRVRPAKISKFCTGLAAIHPELTANKWHRILDDRWVRNVDALALTA